jgi:chemotaxis protein MotB
MRSRAQSHGLSGGQWPGFVDALTTLLLVFVFLLVVFVLAQVVLSSAISGKDEALERLNRQVAELSDLLALERRANAELRLDVAQLSNSLQSAVAARDDLTLRVEEAEVGAEKLKLTLAELESLRRDIEALRQVRAELEARIAQVTGDAGALRDRSKELEARLASQEERTALAQKEIERRDVRLAELVELYNTLQSDYDRERELTESQKAQVAALNAQVQALRREIEKLAALLGEAEAKDKEKEAVIADLGRRLNRALASKVEELSRYRSEFFGRLREILGDRRDVQVVGDRFVFQSEIFFDTASADLGEGGKEQLGKLATALKEIAQRIPSEINWVLRVDGHTDKRPITTPRFPSNWELSAARAISVVQYLIQQGVPAERLVAAGFGAEQPLDKRDDEIALRRNRRIELKLTER